MNKFLVFYIIALSLVAQSLFAPSLAATPFEEGKKAFEAGTFEIAVEKLSRLLSEKPDNFEARYLLGRSYRALGKLKESIRHLRAALKASPAQKRLDVLVELASAHRPPG